MLHVWLMLAVDVIALGVCLYTAWSRVNAET